MYSNHGKHFSAWEYFGDPQGSVEKRNLAKNISHVHDHWCLIHLFHSVSWTRQKLEHHPKHHKNVSEIFTISASIHSPGEMVLPNLRFRYTCQLAGLVPWRVEVTRWRNLCAVASSNPIVNRQWLILWINSNPFWRVWKIWSCLWKR